MELFEMNELAEIEPSEVARGSLRASGSHAGDADASGLHNVTKAARKAGFVEPTYLTVAAWNDSVAWLQTHRMRPKISWHSPEHRLAFLLEAAAHAIRHADERATHVEFALRRVPGSPAGRYGEIPARRYSRSRGLGTVRLRAAWMAQRHLQGIVIMLTSESTVGEPEGRVPP